ncbi:MAG TPA: type II secretion system F family protein [Gammaproteobacteria bacterium]|nr:type II secretion system F family protein [Gammaproteobacteria bacterium]
MALDLSSIARSPVAPSGKRAFRIRRTRAVTAKDRMLFLEQLVLLLETGANLHGALGTLRRECVQPKLASVLAEMSDDISAGRSFSAALARHPQVFSPTYVNLIAASENGGFMSDVLNQLLQMEERREKLRATVMSAVAYPAFLSVFSVAVVVFVLVVVFPKFGAIFAAIRDELPFSTQLLMACSEFLRGYWMQCLAALAAAAFLMQRWARSEAGAEMLDRLKIRAPLLGAVFVKLYLVQSLRAMSLSLANGVSAVETLTACHEVVPNRLFRRFLASVRKNVEDGGSLAAGFNRAGFIPPMVRQLITTGDESGNLAKVMGRIADFYERELEKQLGMLSRLAEPVMLLIMGVLVGLIVSSLILPIFKLSSAVG